MKARGLKPKLRFTEFEEDLRNVLLDKEATFLKGKSISKSDIVEDGVTECIRYGELYTDYGEVICNVFSKTNLPKNELVFSQANDVIIPSSGETALDISTASCVINDDVALGGDLNIIRTKNNGIFLSYYLNSKKKKDIAAMAQGNAVVHLYNHQLKTLTLNLPSLPEQKKIATFLSAVDKKLEQLQQKKTLLEVYKKGVIQQLFSQKLRFKREDGRDYPDWEEKRLEEVIKHISVRNKNLLIDLILSVSNTKGFITQSEQFDGYRVASKDVRNYKIVKKNQFAYNPSRINVGSIAKLNDYDVGIVSPMYVVFEVKKNYHNEYIDFLSQTHLFKYFVKVGCSGSVRDSLNFDDLEKFKFYFPSLVEQNRIAKFLSVLDKKIKLVTTQIQNTQRFKKGLLQQLFV